MRALMAVLYSLESPVRHAVYVRLPEHALQRHQPRLSLPLPFLLYVPLRPAALAANTRGGPPWCPLSTVLLETPHEGCRPLSDSAAGRRVTD